MKLVAIAAGYVAVCGIGLAHAGDRPAEAAEWSASGITPAVTYEGDAASNTSGGERRGTTYSGNLHLQLNLDGSRLTGTDGLSAFLDGLWISGGQPSKLAGDAQGVSNIAAPAAVRLYEAWVQYNFPTNAISVLAGRYDLNTEFYRLASAGLFLNSSFGIGAEFGLSGFAGPSIFPDTALAVRFGFKPGPNSVLRMAIVDAVPLDREDGLPSPFSRHDGVLLVGEAAWLTRPSDGSVPADHRLRIGRRGTISPYDDKIAVGAWCYTTSFNDLTPTPSGDTPTRHNREAGAYLLLDRLLFESADNPKQRLSGFLQFGVARQVVDRFGTYIGAGLVMVGLLPGRPDDEVGLATAMARNGATYVESQQAAGIQVNAAETAVEFTWLAPLTPWSALQPDIQYVIHPNTDPKVHSATVAQLRFELTF